MARRAGHQPQGRAVHAPGGGTAGANTQINTHQVPSVCREDACVFLPLVRSGAWPTADAVPSHRVLAFSEALITAVHISIDGEPLGKGHWAGGPLYVLPWEPSLYLKGLHTIQVKVEVSGGQDVLLRCPVGAARRMFFCFSLCSVSAGLGRPVIGAGAALHPGGRPDSWLRPGAVLPPPHRPLHPGPRRLHLHHPDERGRADGLQVHAAVRQQR